MKFLDPNAWWYLLGLAVPLLIHLLSKKERSIVNFGTLRFLQSVESESARSIQLSQYLLLFIRLLFIACICFLLAKLLVNDNSNTKQYWIEDTIVDNQDYKTILKDIPQENVVIFSLRDDGVDEYQHFKSNWSLINLLNKQRDSSRVYSHSYLRDFKGQPIPLSSHVNWNVINAIRPETKRGVITKDDQAIEWTITTTDTKTLFRSNEIATKVEESKSAPLNIIWHDDLKIKQEKQFRDLIKSIEEFLPFKFKHINYKNLEESSNVNSAWSMIVGQNISAGTDKFIQWIPSDNQLKIESIGHDKYQITGKINKEEILRTNLPVTLASVLSKDYTRVMDIDRRIFDPNTLQANGALIVKSIQDEKLNKKPLNTLAWAILIPLLVVERFYSHRISKHT